MYKREYNVEYSIQHWISLSSVRLPPLVIKTKSFSTEIGQYLLLLLWLLLPFWPFLLLLNLVVMTIMIMMKTTSSHYHLHRFFFHNNSSCRIVVVDNDGSRSYDWINTIVIDSVSTAFVLTKGVVPIINGGGCWIINTLVIVLSRSMPSLFMLLLLPLPALSLPCMFEEYCHHPSQLFHHYHQAEILIRMWMLLLALLVVV